jgi:hypothetical protein
MGDGRVGVKTAGLHGTGGIGKTQLAVEYAHRYRYHYPGGVYWLNAGADWRKEVAACAVNLDRSLIEKSDEEKALAFRDFLAAQGKDVLLVLDNVDDPAVVTRREVAPRLTITKICEDTRARLLLTTRVQTLPTGFGSVSVDVLKPEDARAVLLDAWVSGTRKEAADTKSLDEIAKTLGYLPLALILATAALTKRPNLTPAKLLEHLRAMGIDSIADKVGVEKVGPAGYMSRVDVALEWQIDQLEHEDSHTLLALLAAFGEAVVIPRERLRLLSGLADDDLDAPFGDAVAELVDYHLVEPLSEGGAFRLHPLTQQYAIRHLSPAEHLNKAMPHLVAAYRDPATLDAQTRVRGFATILEDLTSVQRLLSSPNESLDTLTRLLTLEEPHLLVLPEGIQVGYVIQQVRERAHHEGDDALGEVYDNWLMDKRHLQHNGLRYPTSKALLRTLSMHTGNVIGAIQLHDGRILSWSHDAKLRLWSVDGEALRTLAGHTNGVIGTLELADRRILSWSHDAKLRLWPLRWHEPLFVAALDKLVETFFLPGGDYWRYTLEHPAHWDGGRGRVDLTEFEWLENEDHFFFRDWISYSLQAAKWQDVCNEVRYSLSYEYVQREKDASRQLAIYQAFAAIRRAMLEGIEKCPEQLEAQLEAALAMDGGNFDAAGNIIWYKDLPPDKQAGWDALQAEWEATHKKP